MEVLTEQELGVWRTVLRMRRALDRELDAHLAAGGDLTEADYEVLRPLFEAPEHELRVGTLAAAMEWEPSRLSHRLKQMESRDLVRRRASRRDARGSVVGLTEHGAAAYERVRAEHAGWVKRNFIGALGDGEVDALGDLAAKVLERLTETHVARTATLSPDEL